MSPGLTDVLRSLEPESLKKEVQRPDGYEFRSMDPKELFDDDAEYRHLCRIFDDSFGTSIFGPARKTVPFSSKRTARRLSHLNPFKKSGYTEVYQNKNGIKFTLDVQQFRPAELKVKVVDRCVVVEGKHKDRKDYHGFISRSFTRKFFLPKHVSTDKISAKLSLDGLLVVTAFSDVLPPVKVRKIEIIPVYKRALYQSKGPVKVKTTQRPFKNVKPREQRKKTEAVAGGAKKLVEQKRGVSQDSLRLEDTKPVVTKPEKDQRQGEMKITPVVSKPEKEQKQGEIELSPVVTKPEKEQKRVEIKLSPDVTKPEKEQKQAEMKTTKSPAVAKNKPPTKRGKPHKY